MVESYECAWKSLQGNKKRLYILVKRPMPPTGSESTRRFSLPAAVAYILLTIHRGMIRVVHSVVKADRNEDIRVRYTQGYSIPELAALFGLSNARVHQIIHNRRK
jgi:hypothetical protein